MATVSPVTPDPSGADVSGNSITSTAAEASTSAGTTTFDGGLTAPSSSAAVQPGLTSTLLAPHPPDTSSATYSPTVLSKPAPSQVSSPALQLSSGLPISSSSLPQTYSGPSTSTSITPDTQIINPSSSTVPAPTSGNGLSTGAVAGIAVGCAVAGLAIGLLASVFLLRRRIKSASEQLIESRPGGKSPDPRSLMATPVEPATAVSDLDQFLPVPKSDKELAGELQSLGYLIQQHVEDNYHLLPLGESPESLSQLLVDLGVDDGGSSLPKPGQLASMALDPSTRPAALQHIIARVIFGSLTVKSAGEISLLPPSVSSLVREMPPCEKHMGDPQAISVALARWRQITVFLLNPNRSERGVIVPDETSLEPRARQLVTETNRFLGAFVDDKSRQHQEDHLQDVVLECAKLGYCIFCQPAEFTWDFGSKGGRDIVLHPGLVKVSDSQGVSCQPEMTIPPEVHHV